MARRTSVNVARLGQTVERELISRLQRSRLGDVLVSQAVRRIKSRGDSEHKYPDLWSTGKQGKGESYRAGGDPLQDTGPLMASLTAKTEPTERGVKLTLMSPLKHAQYQQRGFTTEGPNFIPLTRKAARTHRKGQDPKDEGLEEGVDYIMAWNGVTVPQRKIYNMPPEDAAELRAETERVLGG